MARSERRWLEGCDRDHNICIIHLTPCRFLFSSSCFAVSCGESYEGRVSRALVRQPHGRSGLYFAAVRHQLQRGEG